MTTYPFPERQTVYAGTARGIDWCIYQSSLSATLNGYVRIPDGAPIDPDTLDVHGGITYSDGEWVGFDTAHAGDYWDLAELRGKAGVHVTPDGERWNRSQQEMAKKFPTFPSRKWTVAKLRAECERLAAQVAERMATA